jgi:hypothetical protein
VNGVSRQQVCYLCLGTHRPQFALPTVLHYRSHLANPVAQLVPQALPNAKKGGQGDKQTGSQANKQACSLRHVRSGAKAAQVVECCCLLCRSAATACLMHSQGLYVSGLSMHVTLWSHRPGGSCQFRQVTAAAHAY